MLIDKPVICKIFNFCSIRLVVEPQFCGCEAGYVRCVGGRTRFDSRSYRTRDVKMVSPILRQAVGKERKKSLALSMVTISSLSKESNQFFIDIFFTDV